MLSIDPVVLPTYQEEHSPQPPPRAPLRWQLPISLRCSLREILPDCRIHHLRPRTCGSERIRTGAFRISSARTRHVGLARRSG